MPKTLVANVFRTPNSPDGRWTVAAMRPGEDGLFDDVRVVAGATFGDDYICKDDAVYACRQRGITDIQVLDEKFSNSAPRITDD